MDLLTAAWSFKNSTYSQCQWWTLLTLTLKSMKIMMKNS